jgi:hypothetical protein
MFRALTVLGAALLFLGASQARAAGGDMEVEEETPAHAFTRSVGVTPLVFLGQLYANYEQLLVPRHGLLAEGGYVFFGPSSGSWSASLGYRYHFSPGLEGLFVGAFLRTGAFNSEVEYKNEDDEVTYDVEGGMAAAGANLGYRWQWGNGVAMSLRGGYGYPFWSDVEWTPDDGENEDFKGVFEALMGLDLEVSVGYSF